MSLCRRSIGTFALAKFWKLRFVDRAFPLSVMTRRINFSCGSFTSPRVIRVIMSIPDSPVPQQSGHQSAQDSQTSCPANPTRAANPQCTKWLLRSRQHITQKTRCQSRRIYNGMRNDSRCHVHQCTLSHNRKRVSRQDSLGPVRSKVLQQQSAILTSGNGLPVHA